MTFRALAAMQGIRAYLAKRLGRNDLAAWDAEMADLSETMTWHVDDLPRRGEVIGLHEAWGPVVVRWDGEVWVMAWNEHPIERDKIRAWAPVPDYIQTLLGSVKRPEKTNTA